MKPPSWRLIHMRCSEWAAVCHYFVAHENLKSHAEQYVNRGSLSINYQDQWHLWERFSLAWVLHWELLLWKPERLENISKWLDEELEFCTVGEQGDKQESFSFFPSSFNSYIYGLLVNCWSKIYTLSSLTHGDVFNEILHSSICLLSCKLNNMTVLYINTLWIHFFVKFRKEIHS